MLTSVKANSSHFAIGYQEFETLQDGREGGRGTRKHFDTDIRENVLIITMLHLHQIYLSLCVMRVLGDVHVVVNDLTVHHLLISSLISSLFLF